MRLEISDNNGTKYIRVVESKSVVDAETGKRVSRKQIIKSIGPVSKFDDGKPNYTERLKASFDAGMPILEELKEFSCVKEKKEYYDIRLFEGTADCFAEPKLVSNLLLEKLLREIDIDQFIRSYKTKYEIDFDVYGFIKLLLFGRLLHPASKVATAKQHEDYFEPIVKGEYKEYRIYDTLDFIYNHRRALFNRINNMMMTKYGRTTNYIYYDVTNFFFETDEQDKDIESETGNIQKGFRKKGVSKEERSLPLVQMGLLMDEQGIPISVEAFPGNTLDHQTLQEAFEHTVHSVHKERYVYCCDKGIGLGSNIGYAIENGNGYITSKSIRKSTKEEQQWILDSDGYTYIGNNFKYKSRIVKKHYLNERGEKIYFGEKQVTYWSKNFFEREKAEKKSFYEFVKKLMLNPDSFRISHTQSSLLKKYIKKEYVNTATGEIIDSVRLKAMLDMDKIKSEFDLLGYYTVISSETNMSDIDIINTYKNLVEIEDQFRVMKSTLEARPIFVRTKEHITAHLTLCAIALIMLRLIQRQVKMHHPETYESSSLFAEGLSADRIQNALAEWKVEKVGDVYYRFCSMANPDLGLILDSFDVSILPKCYKFNEIKHLKQLFELST